MGPNCIQVKSKVTTPSFHKKQNKKKNKQKQKTKWPSGILHIQTHTMQGHQVLNLVESELGHVPQKFSAF